MDAGVKEAVDVDGFKTLLSVPAPVIRGVDCPREKRRGLAGAEYVPGRMMERLSVGNEELRLELLPKARMGVLERDDGATIDEVLAVVVVVALDVVAEDGPSERNRDEERLVDGATDDDDDIVGGDLLITEAPGRRLVFDVLLVTELDRVVLAPDCLTAGDDRDATEGTRWAPAAMRRPRPVVVTGGPVIDRGTPLSLLRVLIELPVYAGALTRLMTDWLVLLPTLILSKGTSSRSS